MYNCIQLDSIYVAFRFPTKPTAPCSLVPVFLGQRRPLIDPSIPSSRQPPTIYLLLVVVVVFSKPPNLPILILWILNLHIIMCPNQSTVILFFVSLVHRCLLDKKRFRTPFLTLQNHFENWTTIGLNFLQHLRPCLIWINQILLPFSFYSSANLLLSANKTLRFLLQILGSMFNLADLSGKMCSCQPCLALLIPPVFLSPTDFSCIFSPTDFSYFLALLISPVSFFYPLQNLFSNLLIIKTLSNRKLDTMSKGER